MGDLGWSSRLWLNHSRWGKFREENNREWYILYDIREGFESLFVTNSNDDANNKLFSHPEYTNLNRLYIGIVSESKKD